MTSPAIDTAHVDIVPDVRGFAGQLKRQLDAAFGGLRAHVGDAGKESGKEYADGFTRDAAGRLRDAKGRFAKAGGDSGKSYGLGFTRGFLGGIGGLLRPLGRQIPLIAAFGSILGGQLVFSLKAAAVAGLAQLAVEIVAALAPAVGALGLLPAAGAAAVLPIAALAVAFAGMGDALKAGIAGDAAKLAEAMKNLAPAAQATVKAIVALKPAALALRQAVQQAFFTGLDVAIQRLATVYLPQLRATMTRVAGSFNTLARDVTAVLTTEAAVAGINDAFDDMTRAIANVNRIVPGLVAGFIRLTRVGATFLPGLTAGFEQAGQSFAAFIARVEASGQLQTFIQGGLSALGGLFRVLGQVGQLLGAVVSAARDAGGGLLTVIGSLLDRLVAFSKTAQGMQSLRAIFAALASVGESLGGALGTILPVLGRVLTELAPLLATVVGNLAPAIAGVVQGIAPLLGLFSFMGPLSAALATLLPVVGQLAGILGGVLAAAVDAITPGLQILASALTTALVPVLPVLSGLLTALAPSLGELAVAAATLLQPLLELASVLLTTLAPALTVLGPLVSVVAALLNAFAGPLRALAGLFREHRVLVVAVAGAFIGWAVATKAVTAALAIGRAAVLAYTIVTNAARIAALLIRTPTLAWAAAQWVLNGALAAIGGPITLIVIGIAALVAAIIYIATKTTWFQTAWNATWGAIKTAFHASVDFLGNLFTSIGQFFVNLAHWFMDLPGRVGQALVNFAATLRQAAVNALNAFLYAIGYGIGTAIKFFFDLPTRVGTALSNMGTFLANLFTTMWRLSADVIAAGINAALAFFFSLDDRIAAGLNALPGLLSSIWHNALAAGHAAVETGISNLRLLLFTVPQKAASALAGVRAAVINALSDARSWLFDAGKNILFGLIDGVGDALGAAIDAVKRAMKRVIQGAKDALGEKSPSKVFAAIGEDTVAGYIAGIQRRVDDATAAVAAMTLPPVAVTTTAGQTAAVAGQSPAAPQAQAADVSAGHTEPVLVQVFLGERELADLVRVVVTDRDRALKRRVQAGSGTI